MMYRITFISMSNSGPRLASVAHPTLVVAQTLFDALQLAGVHVRLWDGNGRLLTPQLQKEIEHGT